MSRPIPAIIEPAPIDTDTIAEQIIVALGEERSAGKSAERHEQLGAAARETAKQRRTDIGRLLLKARGAWPARGPNAKGWGVFLERIGLAESTARMYLDEARDPDGFAERRRLAAKAKADAAGPEVDPDDDGQFGPRIVPDPDRQGDPAPFRQLAESDLVQALARLDPEAKARVLRSGRANVAGGSGDATRGTWCTPKAIATAVGPWDLDPFSNPRSHIAARDRCQLDNGGDGFGDGSGPGSYRVSNRDAEYADERTRVWLQPPYEIVLDVVDHYKHTRFCALLRWSPDVEWFDRLWPHVTVVAFPIGERIAFEPPPGVESSGGAPFPHALLYADERDVTDEVRAICLVMPVTDEMREAVAKIWRTKRGEP